MEQHTRLYNSEGFGGDEVKRFSWICKNRHQLRTGREDIEWSVLSVLGLFGDGMSKEKQSKGRACCKGQSSIQRVSQSSHFFDCAGR